MKIMVTGGAGFIGSHVVDLYLDAGHDVLVVDNLSTGRRLNLNPGARFYQLDIRDGALGDLFAREQPEVVSHLAAQVDVRKSVADPLYDASVNIAGSVNLLEQARQHGVQRVIYTSTGGAVYGEPDYLPVDEGHPVRPLSPYGASKHAVEHYLYLYHENYGLDYTVLRYPNVYGPRQDPHGEAGVVAIFAGQMLRGEQPVIYGDGEQERDFVYVGDCARATLLALRAERNGVYNLASGVGTSINTLYELLATITGFERAPIYGPARVGETRRIYLTADKARRELGWEPGTDLEAGLEQTVAYFQEKELAQR